MSLLRRRSAWLAVLAGIGLSRTAHAQASGFALERFDPAERGSTWFSNESLDLRGDWRAAAGFVFDYAYRPLAAYAPDGAVRTSIVRDQVYAHLGGAVNLEGRLRLAVSVPVAAYQAGHDGSVNGQDISAPPPDDVGDIRLGADVRLFGEYGDALTVAAGAQVYLPTGRRASYTGDETVRLHPRVLAAGTYGPLVYALRFGVDWRQFDKTFAGSGLGTDFTFGVAGGVQVLDKKLTVGPELFGSTVIDSDEGPFKTRNTPFEILLGAHYTFLGWWRAGAGIGPGLSRGYGSPGFRMTGSFEWTPPFLAPEPSKPPPSPSLP